MGSAPQPATVSIEWVRLPASEVHKVCREVSHSLLIYGRITGCSHRVGKVCRVYAPDFQREDQAAAMAVLGHEVKHCFDGAWHRPNSI